MIPLLFEMNFAFRHAENRSPAFHSPVNGEKWQNISEEKWNTSDDFSD